jgi:hypothetical protein
MFFFRISLFLFFVSLRIYHFLSCIFFPLSVSVYSNTNRYGIHVCSRLLSVIICQNANLWGRGVLPTNPGNINRYESGCSIDRNGRG